MAHRLLGSLSLQQLKWSVGSELRVSRASPCETSKCNEWMQEPYSPCSIQHFSSCKVMQNMLCLQGFLGLLGIYFAALLLVMLNVIRSSMAVTSECMQVRTPYAASPSIASIAFQCLCLTHSDVYPGTIHAALHCCVLDRCTVLRPYTDQSCLASQSSSFMLFSTAA